MLTADMAETVAGVSKEHPELEAGHAATVALAELVGLPIVTTNPAPPPGTDDIPKSPSSTASARRNQPTPPTS